MTTAQFSKRKALLFGVNTMKDNFGFFGVFFLVSLIISTVLYFVVLDLLEQNFVFVIVLYGACIALIILLSMGLVKTSLRFCDGEKGRSLAFVYRSLLAQTEVAQGESVETIQEDNII